MSKTEARSSREEKVTRVLAVLNDQTRPPIKTQKEEKLTLLNIYAFTTNLVLHVFGG